ncbi:MAG: hypothetical protein R3A44_12700 [Caldilineaceae bacterium]
MRTNIKDAALHGRPATLLPVLPMVGRLEVAVTRPPPPARR